MPKNRHPLKNIRCSCGRWIRGGGEKCSLCRKKEIPSLYKTDVCQCGNKKSKDAARCKACDGEYRRMCDKFCHSCGVKLTIGDNWLESAQKNHNNTCKACDNKAQRDLNVRNRQKNAEKRLRAKTETMNAYGGKCQCCGESEIAFLTIDHKLNNGAAHRKTAGRKFVFYTWLKKQGYPQDEYQCLCMNCNFAKAKNPGGCPHQLKKRKAKAVKV